MTTSKANEGAMLAPLQVRPLLPEHADTTRFFLCGVPHTGVVYNPMAKNLRGSVVEVKLNPNPSNGDVYASAGHYDNGVYVVEKVRLAKNGLWKLLSAAGLRPVNELCGVTERTKDYIAYRVVMERLNGNGEWEELPACERDLSLDDEEELLYVKKTEDVDRDIAKFKSTNGRYGKNYSPEERMVEIHKRVTTEKVRIKKFRRSLVETWALERAARLALSLKGEYTVEEIQDKTFAVPRIDVQVDWTDPDVAEKYAARGRKAAQGLFKTPAADEETSAEQFLNADGRVIDEREPSDLSGFQPDDGDDAEAAAEREEKADPGIEIPVEGVSSAAYPYTRDDGKIVDRCSGCGEEIADAPRLYESKKVAFGGPACKKCIDSGRFKVVASE